MVLLIDGEVTLVGDAYRSVDSNDIVVTGERRDVDGVVCAIDLSGDQHIPSGQ